MTPSVSISLRACAKTWPGGMRALHPVDLSVAGGEVLALLGPSGCGKTTLLRLVCGLERPDPGARMFFGEQDVTDLPPPARGVGVVFQNYALFPNMSVLENVAYGLRVRDMPRNQRLSRAHDMLALVKLESYAQRRIDQLSGGQRQRVALARALAIEPRVLLLDEPLTALDAKLREHVRVELAQMLRTLGITTLIVTHDQDEAMMLGNRIAVMSAGRIEQIGSAEQLYRHPDTPFVAEFLGDLCRFHGALDDGFLVPGTQALACRPHEIELIADPSTAARRLLHCTVTARYFLGERIRLAMTTDDGQRLHVSAPAHCEIAEGVVLGLRIPSAQARLNSVVQGK
ncbi:MAG: ABC transporter ATP-binding protein [Burkholderiaceae bacterium]|nr:ABC transporter ATP-binding protein [Burkholderiaceae bacterium]